MRRTGALILLLLFPVTAAAASRLVFERTIPARHDLAGVQDLAITYAIGDNASLDTFLDVFVEQTNRSGTLRVYDETTTDTPGPKRRRNDPLLVQRPPHIGALLRLNAFTCRTTERSGEVSSYDVDRNRVKTTLRWVDAVCQAHINALAKGSGKLLAEISARGEGTSARVDKISDEDRGVAMDQAARLAAVMAAEEITPRKVRESIVLADEAPFLEEGVAFIEADELLEARRVWESALQKNGGSAALHFNAGAVCEALGDIDAADAHYENAMRLAPDEWRYRSEHDQFRRRYGRKQ